MYATYAVFVPQLLVSFNCKLNRRFHHRLNCMTRPLAGDSLLIIEKASSRLHHQRPMSAPALMFRVDADETNKSCFEGYFFSLKK